MMRKIYYALRFMTALPLPWSEKEDLVQVSRSSGMFPFVGLLIGGLLYGLGRLASPIFSALTVGFLQTLLWVLLTGGLHLDGLADSMDGLGSRRERERMLEIMKDGAVGPFGVLALILQLMLKTLFCAEINVAEPLLLILVPVTARWGQLIAIRFFPPARKEGMGIFFQKYMTNREMISGAATTLLCYLFLGQYWIMLPLLLLHGLYVWASSSVISRKLGGLTGDVYGFICETGEAFLLVSALLILPVMAQAEGFLQF